VVEEAASHGDSISDFELQSLGLVEKCQQLLQGGRDLHRLGVARVPSNDDEESVRGGTSAPRP